MPRGTYTRRVRKTRKQQGRGAMISRSFSLDQQLHTAFQNEDMVACEDTLSRGANINSFIKSSGTTHSLFSYVKNQDMLIFLEKHGFDWSLKNNHGEPSTVIAVHGELNDYDDLVLDMITETEANWAISSTDGTTPLIAAAKEGLDSILEYLLDYGQNNLLLGVDNFKAYVNQKDNVGKTAYDYAVDAPNSNYMVPDLCKAGAEGCITIHYTNIGTKSISKKTNPTNTISYNDIHNGNNMVNFNSEFNRSRYYTKASFNALGEPKKNPFSRNIIKRAYTYKAKIV